MSSSEPFRNTFADVLRRYVGHGCVWSVAALAQESGLPARRLYAFMEAEYEAKGSDIAIIAAFLPATFLRDVYASAGVTNVSKDQQPMTNPHKVQSSICVAAADLAQHLEDGRLDHVERAKFLPVAERLRDDLNAWISGNVTPIRSAAE